MTAVVEVRFTPTARTGGAGLTTLAGDGQTSVDAGALLSSLGVAVPDPARLFGTLRLTATSLVTPDDFASEAWVSVTRPGDASPSNGVSFPAVPVEETFDGTVLPGDPSLATPVVLLDVRLAAGQVRQLDRVLPLASLSAPHAFARVERISGASRFFAYAVVNDGARPGEGTGDGGVIGMRVEPSP